MKSECKIRGLLEQYKFDRAVEKELNIADKKVNKKDVIIYILQWVLDDEIK